MNGTVWLRGSGSVLRGRGDGGASAVPPTVHRGVASTWGGRGGGPPGGGGLPFPQAKVGLWVFMGVVSVVFTILVSAYHMRMGFEDWKPLPEPGLLWINTGMLILSSLALQWVRVAAREPAVSWPALRWKLYAGQVFAWAFVSGQLLAWQGLRAEGYLVATNPANTFFYLITALHGLHLLGGLVALGRTTLKQRRGLDAAQNLELCALYWHFLLAVWLVLFILLLST